MILKINSSLETVYIWVIVLLGYKGSRATKVFENRKIQFLFKDWLKIHTMYVVLPCTSSLLRVDCGKCQENCTLVNCPRLTFDTLVIFCPTTTFIVINCKCERSVFQHFRTKKTNLMVNDIAWYRWCTYFRHWNFHLLTFVFGINNKNCNSL